MSDSSPELLTVQEAAKYLRIPLPTVYYLAQRGQLPAIQIGGRWRIKRSLLDRDILSPIGANHTTALIVDPDPPIQSLLKQFLEKVGVSHLCTGNAKEALHHAGQAKFDLAFIDLDLPDLPGEELCNSLRQSQPDCPLLLMVGIVDSDILVKVLSAGPVTMVKKPLDFEQLHQTFRHLGFANTNESDSAEVD